MNIQNNELSQSWHFKIRPESMVQYSEQRKDSFQNKFINKIELIEWWQSIFYIFSYLSRDKKSSTPANRKKKTRQAVDTHENISTLARSLAIFSVSQMATFSNIYQQ